MIFYISNLPHFSYSMGLARGGSSLKILKMFSTRPTVCLGATYVVAYTYGYDGGRISPTHCAVIGAGLGDRSRQRRACSRPPAGAGSARIGLVAGSRPGSPADPGGFHQSRTTPPAGTRSCGDASLARCTPDTHPCRLRPCLV